MLFCVVLCLYANRCLISSFIMRSTTIFIVMHGTKAQNVRLFLCPPFPNYIFSSLLADVQVSVTIDNQTLMAYQVLTCMYCDAIQYHCDAIL